MDGSFSTMAMPAQRPGIPWVSASSLAGHGLLIAALLLVSPLRPLVVPSPKPVAVEILSEQQFEALQPKAVVPAPLVTPEAEVAPDATPVAGHAPAPEGEGAAPVTRRATELFAANLLKEPKMAQVRQTLSTLAGSEKIVQLCAIEGIEQIRRALQGSDPDTLVAYAIADMVSSGLSLSAPGGAYRDKRRWFEVSFTCTVAADYSGVTAFAFALGDAIPEEEWEAHDLNAADADE